VTSLTNNIHVLFYLTTLCGLPASVLIFFGIYFAHIPNNQLTPSIPSWLGKIDFDPYWVEYIGTFFLMVLYCNFLRQLKSVYETRREEHSSTLMTGNLNFRKLGNVFLAIILKSTYYFALLGLFFIGTNKVSIFNTILVTFFIVFFISEYAAKKRWILLLITSIVIIFSRYVWGLGIIHIGAAKAKDSLLKRLVCLFGVVDIEDIHDQDITGTTADQRVLTNLLFWILFLFVLLQYDVYRSPFIQKDGFDMVGETDFMKRHARNYARFIRNLKSLYYQGFIWFGYLVIIVTLSLKAFSGFNLIQTLLLFVIFCIHLNKLRSNEATAHKGMYYIWNFFIIITTIVTSARYLYSFTTFDFLDEYLLIAADKYAVFNFIVNQSKLIGFSFNSNLQSRLFGDVLILVCAVSMRSIFKMHKLFHDSEKEESPSDVAGLNDPNEISIEKRRKSILESFVDHRKESLRLIYQDFINISLLKEWPNIAKCLEILSYFFSLIVFLTVALLASLFRLSFGFFIMLCIYCYYFSKVNSAAIKLFKERNIPQKLRDFTSKFLDWFSSRNKKKEKLVIEMIYDEDNLVFKEFVKMTLSWRFTVWNFIFMLSVTLFMLSYFCRMLSFTFFKTYGPLIPVIRLYSINAAFITGVYANNDTFFTETYPYILLIILSVIELKLAHLLREKVDEQLNNNKSLSKNSHLDYAAIEIKENLSEPNYREEEEKENHEEIKALRKTGSELNPFKSESQRESFIKEPSFDLRPSQDEREDYLSDYEGYGKKVSLSESQKNELRVYYTNNYAYLKMKIMEGLLNVVARIVIFMLLLNGAHKENIFGLFYWIGACIAWGATTRYDIRIMVNITNFAIILLLLQYLLLILNLNEFTSPLAPPPDIMYSSLLAFAYGSNIISENQFIKTLGYGFQKIDSTRMIGDSMTFLVLQLFVWTFVLRAEYILNILAKRVVHNISSPLKKLSMKHSHHQQQEDKSIRSPRYVYIKWIVKSLVVHSPRIVVVVMSAIALLTVSLSNYILAILFLLNIILVDFVLAQARIPMKMKFTKILFKVTQFSLIIFLFLYIVDHLPINISPIFRFSAIYIDKAVLFTILQIVVDLIDTEDFKRTYEKSAQKDSIRGRLIALCTTYKFNDGKLFKYLDDYILKKELDEKLVLVSQRISKWHAQFFDEPTSTPQGTKKGKVSMIEEDENDEDDGQVRERTDSTHKKDRKLQLSSEIQSEPIEKEEEAEDQSSKKPKKSSFKKEEESRSKLTNFKIKIVRKLQTLRNPFMFASVSELYKGIVEKNKNLVPKEVAELDYSAFKDLTKLIATLDDIERFYLKLERTAQQSQVADLDENIAKLEEEGLFVHYSSPTQSRGQSFTGGVVALQEVEPVTEKIGPVKSIWQAYSTVPEEIKIVQNREYANYSIWKVLKIVLETWLTYWEYFCYFMLVIYQIDSKALIMVVIPFAIFGYALTEETRPRFKFWTVLFSFIVIAVLLKFTMQYFFYGVILTDGLIIIRQILKVLVGPQESFAFEIILIIIIQIQMAIEIKSGFESGPELIIENINQAFTRKKINDDFAEIKKKLEKNKSDSGIQDPMRDNMRNEISFFDRILNEVEQDFMTGISKFSFRNQTNYFFRLFSNYNKKVGVEVYPVIAIVQLIIAVYILAFYSSMENGNLSQSITSSFRFNEFSGPMVLALFAHIGIVLLDRRIVLINNAKVKKENLEEIDSPTDLYVKEQLQHEETKRSIKQSQVHADADDEEEKEEEKQSKLTKKIGQVKLVVSKIMARMSNAPPLTEEAYHTYSSFAKFTLQVFLLIMLTYFIYWHLPSLQTGYSPFAGTATTVFYLLFVIYFTLSAFQLKHGIPGFKGKLFLMKHYTMWNSVGFKVYRAVPFFFEVKTFMDWTFTHTALDLFQWLKLEDVYGQLFVTKIATDAHFQRKLGDHIDRFSKFTIGFCGITFLLLLILGPLLLFSTYNPLAAENAVIGATVSLGFRIGKNNYFSIFSNSHVSAILNDKSSYDFSGQPALRDVDPDRIQTVTMAPFSEETWGITYPNYELFQTSLGDLLTLLNDKSYTIEKVNQTIPATLEIEYQFSQIQTQDTNIAPTSKTIYYSLMKPTKEDSMSFFQNLASVANCSQNPIFIENFYDSLVRLGVQQAPTNVSVGTKFLQDVYLQLICPKFNVSNGTDTQIDNSYWKITTDQKGKKGIIFFAITNQVSSFLISFSIQAFYVTIVLVIGNVVRNALSGQIQNLTLSDLPAAIELIQICEGILIARADKNLVKEEKLYWELVDILRSPEVLKLITKSAVKEKVRKTRKLKMD